MRIFIILIALMLSQMGFAERMPKASSLDARVRSVPYQSNNVVLLESKVGVATHIQVEENEFYVTHAFGDSKAWEFKVDGNHFFVKPKAMDAGTNLTIVTNLRTYYFKLNDQIKNKQVAMFGVRFIYPDTIRKKRSLLADQKAVDEGFKQAQRPINLKYTMAGAKEIAPVNVWDDGEFTYFKFPKERDLPGIYKRGCDGKDQIVNRHTMGDASDIIVMHGVNARWNLRLGKRVLGVYNETKWIDRTPNTSRTASSKVKRVLEEGEPS